ncbi:mannitol 2-dehydrogenase [Arthrobacter globiformis]|uniref:mannitol dehydrogenase family protein n=1 Tax=Arthrobacter globiformis TaxID=1665 RepID=UPI002788D49E|nr:mannitol dehydrogenase family protein [Arthrobacter globiformis]MDQ1056367.1 mannitol 2-dehydrogenase [Arthrobacter globiformis]
MQTLSNSPLPGMPAPVATPSYDRAKLVSGIVHFGVGGFHRAHQAMYLDRLMNAGQAHDWAIRIVSLTVTEGGYNFHHVTGDFDADNPDVIHGLQPGAAPKTTFGLITEALARRRARGLTPFTVMSCDNIQANGDVARKMFTAFANLKDPGLGAWVAESVPFPNSMVDRITPVTTDGDRAALAEEFGVEDAWPVVCEPFEQWVLEDNFSLGRPPFQDAGVQLVDDVEPYELMKLRLLNASHQGMCYFGYLAGYRYAHEVAQDPLFARFLLDYMDKEATPTLQPVPGIDLGSYKQTLIERFSNQHVKDTLARLCAESSDRIPKWLLPVIRINLDNGGQIHRSAAIVASWARYDEGSDEQGNSIDVVDRLKEPLMTSAARQREDPLAFVSNREVFGDLIDNRRFVDAYTRVLGDLHSDGAAAALQSLTARS